MSLWGHNIFQSFILNIAAAYLGEGKGGCRMENARGVHYIAKSGDCTALTTAGALR